MKASQLTDDRKEDRKYLTLILGGSLIISLATILVGFFMSLSRNPLISEVGEATTIQGWIWVTGTAMMTMFFRKNLRSFYREIETAVADN